MSANYKKLWKLLIDKGMNKTDLKNLTGLSQSTIAKLTNGENVNTDVLERICEAFDVTIFYSNDNFMKYSLFFFGNILGEHIDRKTLTNDCKNQLLKILFLL